MFLTTAILDPQRKPINTRIDNELLKMLPSDYINFLEEYGPGTYCDEVSITYPDTANIPLTFADDTDLWDLDENYTTDDLLSAIQIGTTFNGDIICITANRMGQIFVLPRHDMNISSFRSFMATIQSLVKKIERPYFDPIFESKREQISLVRTSGDLADILPIHDTFLKEFSYDLTVNQHTQPKYFIKDFGGWVSFDLIYKNSITIKYQRRYDKEASVLINLLTPHNNEN